MRQFNYQFNQLTSSKFRIFNLIFIGKLQTQLTQQINYLHKIYFISPMSAHDLQTLKLFVNHTMHNNPFLIRVYEITSASIKLFRLIYNLESYYYQIQFQMGSTCDGEKDSKQAPQFNLAGTDLITSQNLNQIIKKRKQDLRISGYPIDRENDVSKTSLILPACRELSPQLLVKFYLIYSFYINKYFKNVKDRSRYEENFYQLTKQSHQAPQQQLKVQNFRKQYQKESNDAKKDLLMVKQVFKSKFIIQNINKIPLITNDPKDIAHLIFPIARLHRGIKKNHQITNSKSKQPLYIVATLGPEQQKMIKTMSSKDAYFSFSIFIKGFTNEAFAKDKIKKIRAQKKDELVKIYLFCVNFPYLSKMQSNFNYGYYIYPNAPQQIKKQGDVIFNIMNTFKISTSPSLEDKEVDLQYGYLPYLYRIKYENRQLNNANNTNNSSSQDLNHVKIFQLCNAVSTYYLKSQSFLFRIIGGKNDSISVSHAILKTPVNKNNIASDIERQNLINNLLDDGNYEQAFNTSRQGQSFMLKAKQLQILYEQKKYEDASKLLAVLKTNEAMNRAQNSDAVEIIQFIEARLEIRDKKYKKGLSILVNLHKKMMKKYGNDYQFIGRDVIASMQECYRKGEPRQITIQSTDWSIKQTNLNLRSISTSL